MRHHVFEQEFYKQSLQEKVDILPPQTIDQSVLELFHTHDYVEQVKQQSILGNGYLDQGDTPAFIGMYEAASSVVGTVCDAVDRIVNNEYKRAFIPIAGLHHARRHIAAGFCVFNDCGIAIEYLRHKYNIQRIAYVDIDAHHGDGVFTALKMTPTCCLPIYIKMAIFYILAQVLKQKQVKVAQKAQSSTSLCHLTQMIMPFCRHGNL